MQTNVLEKNIITRNSTGLKEPFVMSIQYYYNISGVTRTRFTNLGDAEFSRNYMIWEWIKLKVWLFLFCYCSGTAHISVSEKASGTTAVLLARNGSYHDWKDQEG